MALSAEDEARGLKAYEQARAFERLRTWRLPVTFTGFALMPAVCGVVWWAAGQVPFASASFALAILLAWMARFQWKQLQARHARNLRLLAALEEEHGEALPWVQVEIHFAALENLKSELAKETRE